MRREQKIRRSGKNRQRPRRSAQSASRPQRKKDKAAYWEKEAGLRLLFTRNPLSMWVFDEETLQFIAVNDAAVAAYGYSREEFLRMRITDIRPQEDVPRLLREIRNEHGDVDRAGTWRHVLKNGRTIDVDITWLRMEFGGRNGILVVAQDITERKVAESESEERSGYLKALIENSPLAIAVHDSEGRVQMCNRTFERLFQYRQEEVIGSNLDQLVVPPDLISEGLEITRCTLAGQSVCTTSRRRRKDGTVVEVEIHGVPLTLNGQSTRGYALYQDITERRRLEQQLQLAQKMQAVGRLAGGIAHDFNNILGVVQGNSEDLLERLKPRDPLRACAEEINDATHRAVSLTRQLLTFSRSQVLQPEVLDLNSVISEMGKMLRRVIGEDIELVLLPYTPLERVRADRNQIEQVVINLAVNARDAMPQGGRLTVETANVDFTDSYERWRMRVEPGKYVLLSVSDTGTGMDAETLAHVFEPFFTTKERGKGTGLGLATVYGIVKQSGGHVSAYSELGQGSTFKIYLPQVDQPVERAFSTSAPRELPKGSETVLLVEDDESFRKLIRKFLEQSGYTVLMARNGSKAIQISECFPAPIHLLVTDMVMPGMGGIELAKCLVARRTAMKVLYMSGYTDGAVAGEKTLDGSLAFLQKPFSRSDLVRKVRQVLEAENG